MKKYIVPALLVIGLTGCNSEDMFSGGSVTGVSIKQVEESAHGIFVNDTATAVIDASGGGLVTYAWKVDGQLVGGDAPTYKVQNADWRKMLTVCASIDGGGEACSEELLVLPRHPVGVSGPVNYAY